MVAERHYSIAGSLSLWSKNNCLQKYFYKILETIINSRFKCNPLPTLLTNYKYYKYTDSLNIRRQGVVVYNK